VANTPPRWKRHEKQPERIASQRANEENKDYFSSSFPLFSSVKIGTNKTAGTNHFASAAVLDAVTQVSFAPPKFPSSCLILNFRFVAAICDRRYNPVHVAMMGIALLHALWPVLPPSALIWMRYVLPGIVGVRSIRLPLV
jgi:hypothetical protein